MLKTALVVSLPTTFDAVAFKSPLKDSIQKVADLGYDGVEIALRDPSLVDGEDILDFTLQRGLRICAIGTGQAYGQEGLSFADSDNEIRDKAVNRILDQIALGNRWNAQVIIGLIRGVLTENIRRYKDYIYDCICRCIDRAEKDNVILTIEPINRYETNFLNTVEQTMEFVDKVGSSKLKILVDTFHMNIEEPSIIESIKKAQNYISHVHVADSNRWAPGMGHIDFKGIVNCLADIGYGGYLSAEILPNPDPDTASKQAIKHLKKII